MATKSITVHIDDQPVEVLLASAKKLDGIRRAEMMMEALKLPDKESLRGQAAFFLHPTAICAVREPVELRDMTLDDFLAKVDEADIDQWVAEAYRLNPQWVAGMKSLSEITPAEEKKLGTSSNGSETPTVKKTKNRATSRHSRSSRSTKFPTQ